MEGMRSAGPPTPPPRKHPFRRWQEIGPLKCMHCPFRTNSQQCLIGHEEHHLVRHTAQCFFCTFSAANTCEILKHVNRVHPEEKHNKLVQEMHTTKCKKMPLASSSSITVQSPPKRDSDVNKKCSFCPFSAATNKIVLLHMLRAHPEKKKKLKKSAASVGCVQSLAEALALVAENLPPPAMEEEATNMERVHAMNEPVEQLANQSPPQDLRKVKNVSEVREDEELVNIPPIPIETESTVPEVCEEVEVITLPKVHRVQEIVVVDITMDTDDEENEKVPVVLKGARKGPEKVSCLCGQRQPLNGNTLMISCQECQGWFHGSCVNISEATGKQMEKDDADWTCPRCVPIVSQIRHPTTLIQDVENLATPFQPSDLESGSKQFRKGTNATEPEPRREEERKCEAEMAKLAKELKEAQAAIFEMEKGLKEDVPKMRKSSAMQQEQSRKMVQELEMNERGLSVELRICKDQKKGLDKQLTDLTTEKILLERELAKFDGSSVEKLLTKLEPSGSHSSATLSGNREAIRGIETRLIKVKGELVEVLKGDSYLNDRIVAIEKTIEDTVKTLLELRMENKSLKGDTVTGTNIVDKLKALKNEQRSRIAHFIRLEKRVVEFRYGYVFTEIRRKEVEWMKALEDEEEEF